MKFTKNEIIALVILGVFAVLAVVLSVVNTPSIIGTIFALLFTCVIGYAIGYNKGKTIAEEKCQQQKNRQFQKKRPVTNVTTENGELSPRQEMSAKQQKKTNVKASSK